MLQQKAQSEFVRAVSLHQQGKLAEAEKAYRLALLMDPKHAEAMHFLGVIFLQNKNFADAVRYIQNSLTLNPQNSGAHSNLGNALLGLNQMNEALNSYTKALSLNPGFVDAAFNAGIVSKNMKHYEDACGYFSQVIKIKSDHAEALINLGLSYGHLGQLDKALASFETVLALKPHDPTALANRANTLRLLKRYPEALAALEKLATMHPHYVDAHNNLGNMQMIMGHFQEAYASFEKVLSLKHDHRYAYGQYFFLKLFLCDWKNYRTTLDTFLGQIREGKAAAMPFSAVVTESTPKDQLICSQMYSALECPPAKPLCENIRYQHDKIRIAYLSADLHEHATAYLMAGLFEQHDHSRFEITAYSFGKNDESAIRQRMVAAFDRFIDARNMTDIQIAHHMREHEIDIAIDLKGFTLNNRMGIFTHRPAPIQVNYLGYPGTTGTPLMDYIIADRTIIPQDMENYYSEKVVCLPNSYQPNDRKRSIADTPKRTDLGLPEKGFVFCSFNNSYKITPPLFDIWMRLLKNIEGSVLWLLQSNEIAVKNLHNEAEARGISADRIIFAPHVPLDQHLARFRQADIFLDTLPCNAHTTASDALWAGIPVLTCTGKTFAGRVAASLLESANMPELIMPSWAAYEDTALKLAKEPQKLAAIKSKLAENLSTCRLFDTARYTKNLETAYIRMWEIHQRGEEPQSFSL